MLPLSLLALGLASITSPVLAATAGSFADGGNTLVSAMMMFLGNEEKVYILDKAEGNAATVAGHAAWGAVYDIASRQATVMDIRTNSFCASGMHLPNGSYATFGGNGAIGPGGNIGSQKNQYGNGQWDATYQDFDGTKSIRILNPCTDSDNFNDPKCQWFDEPDVLAMQKQRWYSTAEPLADGSMVLIGGFVNGGYINRNYPNIDPQFEGGAAENTFEFFPANGRGVTPLNFLIKTSGLNAYPHAFLLNSGKILLQANFSTTIWDPNTNQETDLPDMPGKVVRVYPASGAVAMLPLTPANNYNPTILFCGGSDMPDAAWGNYANPAIDTWKYPASRDCQRLTPEPTDNTPAQYVADDQMLEGRTMGQFIILPDGKFLVINGGLNGTAGYAEVTGETKSYSDMPFGMSLASGPVGTPAIYDPNAPAGKRWSNAGLGTSNIARLYHSSAMLLPDGSVLVAGSNPNVDVNLTTIFPTEYRAEIFYPPYFASKIKPAPSGMPKTISYGGDSFDITIPASSYSSSANDAALNTTVALVRGGFTTHAMNMGQRYVQLQNTFTVNKDGSYVLHVGQAPNPNVLQPGPALLFVIVHGVPSKGTLVTVGNGQMGPQPTAPQPTLPANVLLDGAKGSADGSSAPGSSNDSTTSSGSSSHTGLIAGIAGAAAALLLVGALVFFLMRRRRAAAAGAGTSGHRQVPSSASSYGMSTAGVGAGVGAGAALMGGAHMHRDSDSSAFVPLRQENYSQAWNGSTYSLNSTPYKDDAAHYNSSVTGSPRGASIDYDPYAVGRSTPRPVPGRY